MADGPTGWATDGLTEAGLVMFCLCVGPHDTYHGPSALHNVVGHWDDGLRARAALGRGEEVAVRQTGRDLSICAHLPVCLSAVWPSACLVACRLPSSVCGCPLLC